MAICISVSSDLAFAAGVTYLNFIKIHGTEGFHFRLFSDSKLQKMVRIFRQIGADFEVEEYKPPISWTKLWGSKAIAYFSPLVLAKFEGFKLLASFSTVVWLDYDILITKPISELWKRKDFDIAYPGSSQPAGNGFTTPPADLDKQQEGMSAGIMVFRDSFPEFENVAGSLYKLFSKHFSDLYYPEQAVFDVYFQMHFGFKYWRLDEKFGAFPGNESHSNAILHAYGSKKFWDGVESELWDNYYLEWLSRGGSSWNPNKSRLRKISRGVRYMCAKFLNTVKLTLHTS